MYNDMLRQTTDFREIGKEVEKPDWFHHADLRLSTVFASD